MSACVCVGVSVCVRLITDQPEPVATVHAVFAGLNSVSKYAV